MGFDRTVHVKFTDGKDLLDVSHLVAADMTNEDCVKEWTQGWQGPKPEFVRVTTADMIASPSYRAVLREQYASHNGWGAGGRTHAGTVREWALDLKAKTALDYGCGKGTLAPVLPDLEWQEYDPGIVGKDGLPRPADIVVCTDVLEHIEPDRLDAVLAHLRLLTLKGGFFVIALSMAALTLPDGRNAHLIIQKPDWWSAKLIRAGFALVHVKMRKGMWVWVQ